MKKSNWKARWNGIIKNGYGSRSFNNFMGPYNFSSRVEDVESNNPEQLIAAAHAGSFSIYLTMLLAEEGLKPSNIDTTSIVTLDKDPIGPSISKIDLVSKVTCEGLSEERLRELASIAKAKCPVSRLYEGGTAEITLTVSGVPVNSISLN